jgi:LmbE family N-acetylglucosaminyl deacetylase
VNTVVHVSPHPDDEALGAPATLLLLRRAGWRVVNAVVSLGRSSDHARRRDEARDAAGRGRFELVLPDEPFPISDPADHDLVEPQVAEWLAEVVAHHEPALAISPSPHDAHPAHEVVARATRTVIAQLARPTPWWVWGLWADLPCPNLYVPFDDDVLSDAREVLSAYTGELARNDYVRLLEARAAANAVLGSERVFGFGSDRASPLPYAELLTEQWSVDGTWRAGPRRVFDAAAPFDRSDRRPDGAVPGLSSRSPHLSGGASPASPPVSP